MRQDLWDATASTSTIAVDRSVAVVLFKKLNIETRTNTDRPFSEERAGRGREKEEEARGKTDALMSFMRFT